MKGRGFGCVVFAIGVCSSLSVLGGSLEPLTVSPGATDRITGVEARCPTFSWQTVPGAETYQVVVYELPPQTDLTAWSLEEAVEVLFVELPAGVTTWTPPMEDGLAGGADHVWFLRGVFSDAEHEQVDGSRWSTARFFRVVGGGSEQVREDRDGSGIATTATGTGAETGRARLSETKAETGRNGISKRVGEAKTKDVSAAMAAIRGETPNVTGETYGVVGTSNSPGGAGLGAVNTAGGPDLVLDGVYDSQPDTTLSQWGLDRASSGAEIFMLTNSGSGTLDLWVEGELAAQSFVGDGDGLTAVDAETLDGIDSTGFSPLAHLHDDRYYTENELNTSGSGGSVHWDNLGAVPDGFADGIDHDTTYGAGHGLSLDGTTFNSRGSGWAGVLIVAQHGGDFTSIQQAIDAIPSANPWNRWLVWVAPGVYTEVVTMKPFVHLQGAGQGATVITSSEVSTTSPPASGTLLLASDSSVRDLSVENEGTTDGCAAIVANTGTARSLTANVEAWVNGGGCLSAYAVVVTGFETEATLLDLTGLAEGGIYNQGLSVTSGASATVHGGSFTGRGNNASGIECSNGGGSLKAVNVTAIGEGDGTSIHGLLNGAGYTTRLVGGTFVALGGNHANGIQNNAFAASYVTLEALNVTARGENGSIRNHGLQNLGGADAYIQGGMFLGRGGSEASGITSSSGILEITGAIGRAEGGSNENRGLSLSARRISINGGRYTGIGGEYAYGILISENDSGVEAVGVSALAEDATYNRGIELKESAGAVLQGGRFTAKGGITSYGIHYHYGSFLDATGVSAGGEGGSATNRGLVQWGDTVRLGSTQLIGGAYRVSGTLVCVQVIDQNFSNYVCP